MARDPRGGTRQCGTSAVGRPSRAPSTSVTTTGRRQAIASSGASAMPSQRDGRTTRSAARYQAAASPTAPVNSTDTGARAASRARSGPSPTRTSRASGTRARTDFQASSRTSCPFCRHSRPTQTTSGVSAAKPCRRRGPAGSSWPYPGASAWKRTRSTPFGTTDQGPRSPARTPRSRSASLTHTVRAVHRPDHRSQPSARRAADPPTASNDQACGWNTVGIRPRTASRPARPALALCACTRSGRTSSITRHSRRTSATSAGPGERVAGQCRTSAPSARSRSARPPDGQATATRSPAAS
ncbi:hypothetical protein RKD44_004975 [Streptomyces collinus]